MAYLSKVKLANGSIYDLKDAGARIALEKLLGISNPGSAAADTALEAWASALGTAAFKDFETTLADDANLPTGAAVKAYVDSQVGAINKFDVVLDPSGTSAGPSLTANEDNMYKLVLVPDANASAGSYVEYIVIRGGSEGSYTYNWEKIGSTTADLQGYVATSTQIAGVTINDGISRADLQAALELGDMAYADTASGIVAQQVITGVDGSVTPEGSISVTLAYTTTTVNSEGSYTPAGSITGGDDVLTGGSIIVTVKDASSMTGAALTKSDYTPAGTITLSTTDSSLISNVTWSKNDSGTQIEGTNSAPTINVSAPTTTVVTGVNYTAPSYVAGTFTDGSFTKSTTTVASEGLTAAMDTTDTEMLVFSAAGTTTVLDSSSDYESGTFTDGTFTAGSVTANTTSVVSSVSATADAPVFTGAKYLLDPTSATVAIPTSASFTGTTAASIVVTAVDYYKQEIDDATFNPVKSASLGFTGTAATINVAGSYDKAAVDDATFTGISSTVSINDFTVAATTVTVTPDA